MWSALGPFQQKLRNDPKEKSAFLIFLQTFNTIISIGRTGYHRYDSDVEYALRTNHAGRILVESKSSVGSLPLSIWPKILKLSYQVSKDMYWSHEGTEKTNATGLYYLLREGSALIGRSNLGSPSATLSCENNDTTNNNSKKKNPLKRNLAETTISGVVEVAATVPVQPNSLPKPKTDRRYKERKKKKKSVENTRRQRINDPSINKYFKKVPSLVSLLFWIVTKWLYSE